MGSGSYSTHVANASDEIVFVRVDEEKFYSTESHNAVDVNVEGHGKGEGTGGGGGALGVKTTGSNRGHWREISPGFQRVLSNAMIRVDMPLGNGYCFVSIETESGIKLCHNLQKNVGLSVIVSKDPMVLDQKRGDRDYWKDSRGQIHEIGRKL